MKPEVLHKTKDLATQTNIGYDSSLLYKIQPKTELKKAVIQVVIHPSIHSFIHHLCNKPKENPTYY
jgi:uncharacterized UPF0146 family protein